MEQQVLTRAQKRKQRKSSNSETQSSNFKLVNIASKTPSQKLFLQKRDQYDVHVLHGSPGTGKTFLALYSALKDLSDSPEIYKSVKIIRSSVAVRDAGFLPGTIKDKMAVYEGAYVRIASELYGRGDAYEILKNKKVVEFLPTSYTRGITFDNAVIIIDECQNMSFQELFTIITRFGQNCKMYLCGDVNQDDLTSKRYNEQSGFKAILKILKKVDTCYSIEFNIEDIVRSGFIRDFLIAQEQYEKDIGSREVDVFLID